MGKKYVYLFKEGNASQRELLGGKGANLAEMTNLGLPVPEGFTICTDACNSYYENKRGIKEFIDNGYKYNYRYSLDDDIGNKVRNLFYDKYYIYSLILSDILNGGEVNE